MIGNNVLAWSIQIAALVTVAAGASLLLRLRIPRARLFYWQIVLAACLALPLARPWKQQVIAADVSVSTRVIALAPQTAAHWHIPLAETALLLLAIGIGIRLVWLGIGFWRLRRYRRRSQAFGTRQGAALLLAEGISSPVTFGLRRPVVLLPTQFPEYEPRVQEAILCHELLHVRRRDWAFMVIEELIRAAFWFHPAIWWLLGEIGLAREQEVDRLVVAETSAREEYVDALLAIAGAPARLDLAPAPLFLRRRHLKHRVVSILEEVRMSKTRLISSLAASLCMVMAAGWLITATFPLSAAPEAVADSPGVTVDIGTAQLMHRTPIVYPEAAREQGVSGTVVLQAVLDKTGSVSDAQVLSGPEELRRAALQSVLNWHFVLDGSGPTRQVSVTFAPGYAQTSANVAAQPAQSALAGLTVRSIVVLGLSDSAQSELLAKLPVHAGDTLKNEDIGQIGTAVKSFDTHLNPTFRTVFTGPSTNLQSAREVTIEISPGGSVEAQQTASGPRLRVGGNVQSTKLIKQPRPMYPPDAKQARIQGQVKLAAAIGKDGTVQDLNVISGHPLLVPSALEAVKQWVYQPTLLNGQPVEVMTEIDVNYTLSQ